MVGMSVKWVFSLVRKFFDKIEGRIDYLLGNQERKKDLMASLRDITRESEKTLRPIIGTSAGWPWFAEHIVFHVVRRTIERTIGSDLEAIEQSPWKRRVFVDRERKFTLGHDVPLKQLLNSDSSMQRPDICLVHRKRIILTVEVKTAVAVPKILVDAFEKLTRIQKREPQQRPRSRAFFVSYAPTLQVKPHAVVASYRKFYEAKGRYVGRFDSDLKASPLFANRDSRGSKMELVRLENCLEKVEELLGKLPNV